MRILITAFEPFDGRITNSSLLLLDQISLNVDKKILPVDADKIYSSFEKLSIKNYDIVIMLGEANIPNIRLELVAKNILDMRIKDNQGNQFSNEVIVNDGRSILRTNLLLDKLNLTKFDLSKDAGSFLCNMAYYLLLNDNHPCDKAFVHIPINNPNYKETLEELILEITKTSNFR